MRGAQSGGGGVFLSHLVSDVEQAVGVPEQDATNVLFPAEEQKIFFLVNPYTCACEGGDESFKTGRSHDVIR